jgi:HD-GYP domain-containing protein (c-di-GMP phosphodiesterase class II)
MLARPRLAPSIALCGVGAALPATALLLFGRDLVQASSHLHFVTVGGSALVAALASIVLTVIGARHRDGRTVLVATAFSAMAALLLLHGIASPGVIVGMNGVVALSGALTLPFGAAVLALSGFAAFRGPRAIRPLVVLQAGILVGTLALGIAGLVDPHLVPSVPQVGSPAALTLVVVSLALFAFLILRSLDTYVLTQRRSDAAVVVGLAFLAAALVGALDYEYFELGWWLGHGFEIVGLVLVGAAVVLDMRRADQSRPLTGGLAAERLVAAEETFLGTRVRALTVRLAEKDCSTEEHTRRVALLAVQIGESLGLPRSRLRSLATGGLLHDIGKLAVPDEILKKPGSLTEEEFGVIQRHPEWGHHLLRELGDFAADVRRLVLDHHERLDGSGYPRGLTEAQLDLETRILAVCDVYDALISPRVYRDAWAPQRALDLLREGAGRLFDPRCVAALERVVQIEREALGVAV